MSIIVNPFIILGGSLSFIAGLAWNEVITTSINQYYPAEDKKTIKAKLIYALLITVIIVIFALLLDYLNTKALEVKKEAVELRQTKAAAGQYKVSTEHMCGDQSFKS
jgi:hypothetical protein